MHRAGAVQEDEVSDRTELTPLELEIARKYSGARFPPATAAKRFARGLGDGFVRNLSDRGRATLAYFVHRYRRQYKLTAEEQAWVDEWRAWAAPPVIPKEKPVKAVKPVKVKEQSGDLFV
jgi:hypothetical protein